MAANTNKPGWQTTLEQAFQDARTQKGKWPLFLMWVLLIAAMYFFTTAGQNYSIQNSRDSTIIANAHNVTINQGKQLRQWGDLPLQERRNIKQEIWDRFPDIAGGQVQDWRPVAEWLAQEKGVITPSPRDLFRER